LAQALDQAENDSAEYDEESGSESDDDDESSHTSSDEDEADVEDPSKLSELRSFISGFAGSDKNDQRKDDASQKQKAKIGLKDLGLFGVKDSHMKKSLKLMSKEEKETRPGSTKKLDIPLARRQQAKLDRNAAYEQSNKTLDRWTETIKHNRRAEHLIFPLPQNLPTAGLGNAELQPIAQKSVTSELEMAVMSIMEESGLSMNKPNEAKKPRGDEVDEGTISRSDLQELWSQRRLQRELNSREAKRAKRIKKIKSKAYHRVHRRQREREELATHEALAEAGELDSEEEREAQDRRRALERVGARHRDSKWAKMAAKTKRAVWDDEFREGLHDMAKRDEELRRRKEGKHTKEDEEDDTSDASSDSDEGSESLLHQLDRAARVEDTEPQSKIMALKFMKRAEAAMKKANDDLVHQIRKDLASDNEFGDEEEELTEIGRKQYGLPNSDGAKTTASGFLSSSQPKRTKQVLRDASDPGSSNEIEQGSQPNGGVSVIPSSSIPANSVAGAWSQGELRRKSKKVAAKTKVEDLDLNAAMMLAGPPLKAKASQARESNDSDADSDEGEDLHLPLAIRDQELVARAFAGEDVVGEFEREKAQMEEEDDDKVIDNTLPGWGSWVGDGVSSRDLKRNQGRFLTKVEGVKKKDRKDAKLQRVIVSEKRAKKVQYIHPFNCYSETIFTNTLSRTTNILRLNYHIHLSLGSSTNGH
jgi:U3 small nucleolar RNA-associated protein 14